jgi:hypothetical protein
VTVTIGRFHHSPAFSHRLPPPAILALTTCTFSLTLSLTRSPSHHTHTHTHTLWRTHTHAPAHTHSSSTTFCLRLLDPSIPSTVSSLSRTVSAFCRILAARLGFCTSHVVGLLHFHTTSSHLPHAAPFSPIVHQRSLFLLYLPSGTQHKIRCTSGIAR